MPAYAKKKMEKTGRLVLRKMVEEEPAYPRGGL
jgi:hypothetical protein